MKLGSSIWDESFGDNDTETTIDSLEQLLNKIRKIKSLNNECIQNFQSLAYHRDPNQLIL